MVDSSLTSIKGLHLFCPSRPDHTISRSFAVFCRRERKWSRSRGSCDAESIYIQAQRRPIKLGCERATPWHITLVFHREKIPSGLLFMCAPQRPQKRVYSFGRKISRPKMCAWLLKIQQNRVQEVPTTARASERRTFRVQLMKNVQSLCGRSACDMKFWCANRPLSLARTGDCYLRAPEPV